MERDVCAGSGPTIPISETLVDRLECEEGKAMAAALMDPLDDALEREGGNAAGAAAERVEPGEWLDCEAAKDTASSSAKPLDLPETFDCLRLGLGRASISSLDCEGTGPGDESGKACTAACEDPLDLWDASDGRGLKIPPICGSSIVCEGASGGGATGGLDEDAGNGITAAERRLKDLLECAGDACAFSDSFDEERGLPRSITSSSSCSSPYSGSGEGRYEAWRTTRGMLNSSISPLFPECPEPTEGNDLFADRGRAGSISGGSTSTGENLSRWGGSGSALRLPFAEAV